MSFALKHRPIGHDLRRLVHKELRNALHRLDYAANGGRAMTTGSIHEVRKALKKVRAIMKLVKGRLGRAYAVENRRLRAAGRTLAAIRDAAAVRRAFDQLLRQCPGMIDPNIEQQVTAGLARHQRVAARPIRALARDARRGVQRARHELPATIEDASRRRAVRSGLERSYQRASLVFASLAATSGDKAFHEWRRRVKEHWYQTRLFQKGRRAIRGRVRALKRLEAHLGEDHDLATLARLLRRQPERFGGDESATAVLACIERRQATLRRDALVAGRRLFTDEPGKVAATIVDGWSA